MIDRIATGQDNGTALILRPQIDRAECDRRVRLARTRRDRTWEREAYAHGQRHGYAADHLACDCLFLMIEMGCPGEVARLATSNRADVRELARMRASLMMQKARMNL